MKGQRPQQVPGTWARVVLIALACLVAVLGSALDSVRVGLTMGVLVGALALIGCAVHAIRAEVAHERAGAGRPYDAVHAEVRITQITWSASGPAIIDLTYRSRQILFLDNDGLPASAQTTGPGSITVLAPPVTGQGLTGPGNPLSPEQHLLTLIERGVQTGAGRVVHECLLTTADGGLIGAQIAASTLFPAA